MWQGWPLPLDGPAVRKEHWMRFRRAAHAPYGMASPQCFRHEVAATEAVGADDKNFLFAHGSSTSTTLLRRAAAPMSVLPMVSTARAVMQRASAAVGIITRRWPGQLRGLVMNRRHQLHPAVYRQGWKAWLLSMPSGSRS